MNILRECEAVAYIIFLHLGHYFERGDYQDAPLIKVLHFFLTAELLKCWNTGDT